MRPGGFLTTIVVPLRSLFRVALADPAGHTLRERVDFARHCGDFEPGDAVGKVLKIGSCAAGACWRDVAEARLEPGKSRLVKRAQADPDGGLCAAECELTQARERDGQIQTVLPGIVVLRVEFAGPFLIVVVIVVVGGVLVIDIADLESEHVQSLGEKLGVVKKRCKGRLEFEIVRVAEEVRAKLKLLVGP